MLNSSRWTVLTVGVLLSLIYLKLGPHVHNYPHAGKEFYVGARLLAAGHNPYDSRQLQAESQRAAPEGYIAGKPAQPQLHLPATMAAIALFSGLPWGIFWRLQVVLSAFCVPAIVTLCLRYLSPRPSPAAIGVTSLAVAFLAPTWQNIVVGQIALPLVLCLLLAAQALRAGRTVSLGVFAFLMLLKYTFAVPFLAFALWRGTWSQRAAVAMAVAGFLALNAAAILHIGPNQFLASYRQQVAHSFAPGGLNDPQGPMRGARVDIGILLASLFGPHMSAGITLAVWAVLAGLFVRRAPRARCLSLRHVSLLALLTLTLFYHRAYDAVLLVPSLFLLIGAWRDGLFRPAHAALAFVLVFCLASIGSEGHNLVDLALRPFHRHQPPELRALCVLAGYLLLVFVVPEAMAEGRIWQPAATPLRQSQEPAVGVPLRRFWKYKPLKARPLR